ncbi:MAG: response regulator [Phycisphaerales bacterium]|nr:response regulator [Phycisphaerales bacterium]
MSTSQQRSNRYQVLCIDDEPGVHQALKRELGRLGCRVHCAENGADGLDILNRESIQLLICDATMPGMHGVDVLMTAASLSPNTTRVLLTAHCANPEVVVPAINGARIFRLIPKPWPQGAIRQLLMDVIGMHPRKWSKQKDRIQERLVTDAPD